MAAPLTPTPSSDSLNDLEYQKYRSDGTGFSVAVVNPDGTRVGSSTGTSATQVQGNVASGATDSGNPVKIGGIYNSSPITLTNGQRGDLQLDQFGDVLVNLATKLDRINDNVTAWRGGSSITTISTATTTTIANFPVYIEEIRVLGGTLGNVTVYDNTAASGTNPIPAFTPTAGQVIIDKSTIFSVGCVVVTAAATLVIVTWRSQQ